MKVIGRMAAMWSMTDDRGERIMVDGMVAMWSTADGHGGLTDGMVVLWSTADGHGGLADGMVAMWSTTDSHDGLADGMVAMVVNGGWNGAGKVKCMKVSDILERRMKMRSRINLRRTFVTGFPAQSIRSSNAIALDSPNLLVLNTGASQSRQHESRKSPTAELFDVDSERISIRHCEY
nr:hypothetical protein [Tanacetum cinerariifolium]